MAASATKAAAAIARHDAANGIADGAPQIVVTREAASACGRMDNPRDTEGFVGYCPADDRIYIADQALRKTAKAAGTTQDVAVRLALAHEAGHRASGRGDLLQLPPSQVRREENHADCYAGAVTGHTENRPSAAELSGMRRILAASGDGAAGTHDKGSSRVRWFDTGLREGVDACQKAFDE